MRKLTVFLISLGSLLLLIGASAGGEREAPSAVEPFPSKVVWTPDGKHIIFSRGFQGIFMVDVAGSELRAIPEGAPMGTAAAPGYTLPSLSLDGSRLAFVARPSGLAQSAAIMVSALDGTGIRRLTHDEGYNTHPAWSPDGTEIAYIADGKLTVMRADGTSAQVLAPSVEVVNAALAWSPDGSRIAFVGMQQDAARSKSVYTVQPDGTGLTELGPTVSVPSWSPDGGRIAFVMPEDYGEASLITLDNMGNDPQSEWSLGRIDVRQPWSLLQTGRWYDNVAWSPGGAAIVFAATAGSLVLINFQDIEDKVVSMPGRWAAWSHDGERITVLADYDRHRRKVPANQAALFTVMRYGRFKRVLVVGNAQRLAAKHPGWYDVSRAIAACGNGYVVSDPRAQGLAVPMLYINPGLVEDCEILMALRDRLAGDFLLNWSAETSIREWWGVLNVHPVFGMNPDRVEGLWFPYADFRPDIVTRSRNSSSTSPHDNSSSPYYISATMGMFLEMYLARGLFGGATPLSSYPNPRYPVSGDSGLNGVIPSELADLPKLQFVNLSNNSLTGSIPAEFGSINRLHYLGLSNNALTSSIPPELADSDVTFLDLSGNQLSGGIPPELGAIVSRRGELRGNPIEIRLLLLDLADNNLSGSIPAELRQHDRMAVLDLRNNNLSGEIPAWLGDFLNLRELDLSHNELTGSIPPGLGDLVSLNQLDLSHNRLSGHIPSEFGLGRLVRLIGLDLSHNRLSGHIPPEWGPPSTWDALRNLEVLNLAHNDLNGTIPPELADLRRLMELHLQGNDFTGCIPAAFSRENLTIFSDGWEFCAE